MYRTRFMILVIRCLLCLVISQNNPTLTVKQKLLDDCEELIKILKQHGGG